MTRLFADKRERNRMHFHSRRRSKRGIAGFVLSVTGVIVFAALCVVTTLAKGEAGALVGVCGLLLMVLCGSAFFLSLKGLKEKDVYTTIPFAGLVISGVMFVLLFCLYVIGIKF